jgi:SAM-dependent methyltransferase
MLAPFVAIRGNVANVGRLGMDLAAFAAEAAIEADHWWFVGRRLLFAELIKGFGLPRNAEILDVGTSTGTNLRLLRDLGFARITGVDQSPDAVRFCAEKGLGAVQLGDIRALQLPDRRFDLVLATDVIEHVDDDRAALLELRRVLRPGGYLLLTVPAFPLLWGLQDEVSHHKRRYRLPRLLAMLHITGLSPRQHFYFNYLLFLPILAARRLMRILKITIASEGEINSGWLNRALIAVFRFDVETAPWLQPPFGVSALVVATRT